VRKLTSSEKNWANKQLPSTSQVIEFLKENHCSTKVIAHCKAVSKLAVETAQTCQKKGQIVDVNLVEIGALLHDIGRSKTQGVDHVVVGAKIARAKGLPNSVISIIERHIGGGITEEESKVLGWPKSNYMPMTLEEKIVSYADKLVETSDMRVPIEVTIEKFKEQKLFLAAERMRKIHNEIESLAST
jgi:uncharacterized protein